MRQARPARSARGWGFPAYTEAFSLALLVRLSGTFQDSELMVESTHFMVSCQDEGTLGA